MGGRRYRQCCAAALLLLAMAGAGCARTPMKRQDGTAENTGVNKTGTTAPGGGSGTSGGPISETGSGTVDTPPPSGGGTGVGPVAPVPGGATGGNARAGMTDGGVIMEESRP